MTPWRNWSLSVNFNKFYKIVRIFQFFEHILCRIWILIYKKERFFSNAIASIFGIATLKQTSWCHKMIKFMNVFVFINKEGKYVKRSKIYIFTYQTICLKLSHFLFKNGQNNEINNIDTKKGRKHSLDYCRIGKICCICTHLFKFCEASYYPIMKKNGFFV